MIIPRGWSFQYLEDPPSLSLSLSHPIERGVAPDEKMVWNENLAITRLRARNMQKQIVKVALHGAGVNNGVELLTGRSQGRDTFQLN